MYESAAAAGVYTILFAISTRIGFWQSLHDEPYRDQMEMAALGFHPATQETSFMIDLDHF